MKKESTSTELSLIDKVEIIKKEAKTSILANTIKSEEKLDLLIKQYLDIEIKDKAAYDFAVKGSKEMKKIRTAIDSNRLDITRPFNDFKSDMIAYVKPWTTKISTAESEINEKIKTFENIEKAKAEALFAERCQLLAKNGFTMVGGNYQCGAVFLSPEQIQNFNQEEFDLHIEIGKGELQRQEVEKQRKAEEAAILAKERQEIAQMKADMVKMKAEMAKEREEMAKDRLSIDAEIAKLNPPKETGVPKMENPPKPPPIKKTANKIDKVIAPVEKQVENLPPKEIVDQFQLGRQAGFEEYRTELINLMDSGETLTRPFLNDWAKSIKIK